MPCHGLECFLENLQADFDLFHLPAHDIRRQNGTIDAEKTWFDRRKCDEIGVVSFGKIPRISHQIRGFVIDFEENHHGGIKHSRRHS